MPPVRRDGDLDKQRLRRLQQVVADVAGAHGILEGSLASRRWLEALMESWPEWPRRAAGLASRTARAGIGAVLDRSRREWPARAHGRSRRSSSRCYGCLVAPACRSSRRWRLRRHRRQAYKPTMRASTPPTGSPACRHLMPCCSTAPPSKRATAGCWRSIRRSTISPRFPDTSMARRSAMPSPRSRGAGSPPVRCAGPAGHAADAPCLAGRTGAGRDPGNGRGPPRAGDASRGPAHLPDRDARVPAGH